MADTRNMVLTIAGMNLLAKCQQGKELHFTRVMMGDGELPDGMEIRDMTDMIHPILRLPVANISLSGTGTSVMECIVKNAELEQGFFAREVGVFASDPDTGEEVLYSIRNTGNYSDYVPAGGGADVVNYVYSVITVVGQSENVTVTIEEGLGGLSRAEFYEHQNSQNPHPNLIQIGGAVEKVGAVFVSENNNPRRLERMPLDKFRKQIMGESSHTLPVIGGRISQLELELANIGVRLDGPPNITVSSVKPVNPNAIWIKVSPEDDDAFISNIFDDLELSNMIFYDSFFPVQEVETLKISVNAITAGSRTIGVASLEGIKPGQWYTVTDGIHSEDVQVKASSKNDGILRVMVTKDIQYTYVIADTVLMRTTADLVTRVTGAAGAKGIKWNVGESIFSKTREFSEDGISALAFAQCMIYHDKLDGAAPRAFVTFSDEVHTATDVSIGTGTGERQTLTLPDTGVDYNSIEIKVDGVKYPYFSANTETEYPEVTLTVTEGAAITASYKYGYGKETWEEMVLASREAFGSTGLEVSKFEYDLPEASAAGTRTAIKFVLEDGNTVIYAVAMGWAKA